LNLIYAYANSEGDIDESDEVNNSNNTGLNCQVQSVPGSFDPKIKWSWTASTVMSDYLNVMMTTGVIDLNEDGAALFSTRIIGGPRPWWIWMGMGLVNYQKSDDRSQKTDDRGQKSDDRGQKSDDR
jgi:hypothetical protein